MANTKHIGKALAELVDEYLPEIRITPKGNLAFPVKGKAATPSVPHDVIAKLLAREDAVIRYIRAAYFTGCQGDAPLEAVPEALNEPVYRCPMLPGEAEPVQVGTTPDLPKAGYIVAPDDYEAPGLGDAHHG